MSVNRRRLCRLGACVAALTLLFSASTRAENSTEEPVVHDGSQVSLEYTLTLGDGTVVDTNVGHDALVYTQGRGQLLPALEAELAGLKAGDAKQVTLTPENGYGKLDEEAIVTVPINEIPEDARKVGAQLTMEDAEGNKFHCRVREVQAESVILDFNHPLAGQTLHFDVKVLAIK